MNYSIQEDLFYMAELGDPHDQVEWMTPPGKTSKALLTLFTRSSSLVRHRSRIPKHNGNDFARGVFLYIQRVI